MRKVLQLFFEDQLHGGSRAPLSGYFGFTYPDALISCFNGTRKAGTTIVANGQASEWLAK